MMITMMMMIIMRILTIQDGEKHIFTNHIVKVIHIRKFPKQVFLVFKNYNIIHITKYN